MDPKIKEAVKEEKNTTRANNDTKHDAPAPSSRLTEVSVTEVTAISSIGEGIKKRGGKT